MWIEKITAQGFVEWVEKGYFLSTAKFFFKPSIIKDKAAYQHNSQSL